MKLSTPLPFIRTAADFVNGPVLLLFFRCCAPIGWEISASKLQHHRTPSPINGLLSHSHPHSFFAFSPFFISSSASLCLSTFLSCSQYSLCYPFVILIMSLFSPSLYLFNIMLPYHRVGEKGRGGKGKNQPGERGLHHIQDSNGLLTSAHQ